MTTKARSREGRHASWTPELVRRAETEQHDVDERSPSSGSSSAEGDQRADDEADADEPQQGGCGPQETHLASDRGVG
jgi:hypothetical protein